jgi:hypothetical protein
MKTAQIQDLINQVFEGTKITDEIKNALIGAYSILYYKSLIEALFIFRKEDPELLTKINKFFTEQLGKMQETEMKKAFQLMEDEKIELLSKLIKEYKSQLDPDLLKQIDANLQKMAMSDKDNAVKE